MGDAFSDVPAALSATVERVRLDVPALNDEAVWVRSEAFAICEPTQAQIDAVASVLRARGLRLRSLLAVRHAPGESGLPEGSADDTHGFVVDLSDARRTLDGGILLFAPPSGAAYGWRAQTGVMTLWRGPDPELTELAPGAPARFSLIGRASPA